MVGLITRLSLLAKNLTAFKFGKVAKSGNAGLRASVNRVSSFSFHRAEITGQRWTYQQYDYHCLNE